MIEEVQLDAGFNLKSLIIHFVFLKRCGGRTVMRGPAKPIQGGSTPSLTFI